ncbi:3-deoxy-7-phosphoheptulonate synthase [Phosphitispora fastidiosa]|uniref:3-deoxy-7-phosphoheptulonate synthase n=1 Tax=Phosphitispora fastidiosa TaxID=2837202 RepID=UPI001E461976|nr:3-deoxy-7-phosphoheptulonate synthase [Phosphitispora fastidiosa]MBU7005277.1 3-deoxy-7-phosphoheptulonate synthase [Phosphitispora fastidiosa]
MRYKLASRTEKTDDTIITVGDSSVGGKQLAIIAGPCAVEDRDLFIKAAVQLKNYGVQMLRGGAFKPRTSPYAFQGLAEEGLKILAEARRTTGLPVVTEVMDTRDVELVAGYADVIQIGSRNMQNFVLLKEVGRGSTPVLLKRGLAATIEEWLMAAEYVMAEGNKNVILCERGIRTFETHTRNTLDISAIPAAHHLSHLPVIVDPSHAAGKWGMVAPLAKAAVAAGADGLIIEVHPCPAEALSDGGQSLNMANFSELMSQLVPVAEAVGRKCNYEGKKLVRQNII